MKFIHIADLHLGIYKYGKFNYKTGLNTRLEEDLALLDYVIDYTIETKADIVVITGDIFHTKKPDAIVRREFIKRMKRLQETKIYTIVLMGNHDNVKAFDKEHCLAGEKILTNEYLHIVDSVKTIDIIQHNVSIICMPSDQVRVDLNKYTETCKNVIVLGHFTISGAKKDNYTFAGSEYISSNYFNNDYIKYVAMGHIHQMQRISNKIAYSGSLNRIDFGDEHSKKGFIIGELKDDKLSLKIKYVKTREFLTINKEYKKGLKQELAEIDVKNKIVRLILKSSYSVYAPIDKIKKYLVEKGAIVDSIKVDRQRELVVRNKQYKQDKSPIDLLQMYLKDNKVAIEIGKVILKEVE